MKKKVITRFAPSPTGFLHLGNYRTALFNYVYAKQHKGKFILRIEDTDSARSKKEYEEDIVESLKWLGIAYDEMYRQSDRKDIYARYVKKLIADDQAYESIEERKGEKNTVIRFRNPKTSVVFSDALRGEIRMETGDLGDFVIARSVSDPVYHLAVVIDDFEMGITHCIRGEDHISNTPRQILLQRAIGAPGVIYAHVPLVLAPDRSKLSKRHGALPVREYKRQGYLPEALLNFLALLGWSPQAAGGTLSEIFTMKEFMRHFSFKGIQKGGAIFNEEKLKSINREHIKRLSLKEREKAVLTFLPPEVKALSQYSEERLLKAVPLLIERIEKFSDVSHMHEEGELDYFFESPEYVREKLLGGKEAVSAEEAGEHLRKLSELLVPISEKKWYEDSVKNAVWDYATEKGRGKVLWPFRYALSGRERSPDPFTIASILGKEETLGRLKKAILLLTEL